jgi:phospholipid/cholesterol/gamma-HCH transport system ATP-binding protein
VPIRKEIGMLFQNSALFDSMTVEQNIMFPLNLFTEQTRAEKLERVNFCLERVNLAGKNKLYPSELSGGMKKRVGIARAISMQPKYLFVDEPNSGLDPKTSILIDELINELTEEYNITTVIVTHDMNSVMGIGEHIIFLHNGKKWWEGSNKEIAHTDNKELNDFVFASKFMQAAKAKL